MGVSSINLINRVRRFVRDWPEFDEVTASVSSSATSLTVADATIYQTNWMIQVEREAMMVKSGSSGTTLNVRRAVAGTTATTHVTASRLLVRPRFLDQEILDAINGGLSAAFPMIYRKIVDETIATTAGAYEYAIPDVSASEPYAIPYISEVWLQEGSDLAFRRTKAFRIIRDEGSPFIQFRRDQPAGAVVRILGFGPYYNLTTTDSLGLVGSRFEDFPVQAEELLVWYAAQSLLASGEAGRVSVDTGVIDDREQANRAGSSMAAANSLFQRFQIRLSSSGLPPMPKHVIATF